jgi:hypothetical protein
MPALPHSSLVSGWFEVTASDPDWHTLAFSSHAMAALSQSARVSGWIVISRADAVLSCAEMALPPKTASTTAMITISQSEILVMLILRCDLQVKLLQAAVERTECRLNPARKKMAQFKNNEMDVRDPLPSPRSALDDEVSKAETKLAWARHKLENG